MDRMRTKILAQLIGFVVVAPSTLVALFYSALGLLFAVDAIRSDEHVASAVLVLLCLFAGWFGIFSLWRAYYLLAGGQRSFSRRFLWIGFGCGGLVSAVLIAVVNGSLLFRALFFGWPMLAVIPFTVMLLRTDYRATSPEPGS